MPLITFDPATKTMSAVLNDNEFAVVLKVITNGGLDSLTDLFVDFIRSNQINQIEQDRIAIKRFADQATPEQRTTILAMMAKR